MARRSQYSIWFEEFKPIENTRGPNGIRFETYGADLEQVLEMQKTAPEKVWTLVDTDGKWSIAQGYHVVNRVAYIITEMAFNPANPVHVRRYRERDVAY